MNTLDDLLPDLRRLLPASLRGTYLDGYVRRRRTPMELLLSRSLPNTHPAASTFEDVRAEIQALRMPQWVANRYLSEAEQALAVGQDTREVVGRAKVWMATHLVDDPRDEADFAAVLQLVRGRGAYYEGSGHKLAEGMTDEAVATRLWDAGFRAHMDLVEDGARLLRAAGHDVSTERQREAWDYKPTEPIDRFMAAYEPALYEALRKHPDEFSYTAAEVPDFLPRWRNALLTEDFNHDGYAMRGACKRLGLKCTKQALLAFLRPKVAEVRPQLPSPDDLPSRAVHEPPPIPREGPETPLYEQDRHSVDVLENLIASLSNEFIITPIRAGHGYRVVDLRSRHADGVFTGLPPNTYLTTVSLRHSGPSQIIGDKAYLVQSTRDAGLSHDHHRAIRRFVVETVERMTDEAQGKATPAAEEAPDRRRYHVIVVNERTGAKHIVSRPDEPLTHAEGVTFLSKMSAYPGRRNQLQEVDDSSENPEKSADTMREEFEEFERSAEQARAIFLPFPWVLPSRLANYSRAMRPGDPARFGDLPPLPAALVSKQIAALNKLPPDFLEALKRYMIEIVELSLEDVVRNGYGVWQSPAVLAEVGPANVKIVKMNRGGSGSITEIELNGSTHTLVRRKDGAILKSGAPPASAVRGNIYTSPAEIRGAITAYGAASRR